MMKVVAYLTRNFQLVYDGGSIQKLILHEMFSFYSQKLAPAVKTFILGWTHLNWTQLISLILFDDYGSFDFYLT